VSTFQALLIAALLGIAVVHTRSRIGGALATMGWCIAAAVYGGQEFAHRDGGLVFLGVQTPKWLFFFAMAAVGLYNLVIAVRGLTRRVAGSASSSPSAPST
jgi:hypothetical protein